MMQRVRVRPLSCLVGILVASCTVDGGQPIPQPPDSPILVPEGATIVATSRVGRQVALRVPTSTVVLVDLRSRTARVVTERLAEVPEFGIPVVLFTASGGLYFSESAADGTVAPVIVQDGSRRSFNEADQGRTHAFELDPFPSLLLFLGDRDVAVWSDESGEVMVLDRDASEEDLFFFPTGELRVPGSGAVKVFRRDFGLVPARPSSSSGNRYQLASVEGLTELPEVDWASRDTRRDWCGFDERTIHRVDLGTGARRSERVAEVLEEGRAGGDCVAIVKNAVGEVSIKVVASAGVRDTPLSGVTEVSEPFSSGALGKFLTQEQLGLVAVEGEVVRVRDFGSRLRDLGDAAPLDRSEGGIIAYQHDTSVIGASTFRLIAFGADGIADVIEEFEGRIGMNPCYFARRWPYIDGPVSAVDGLVVKCEAQGERLSRLIVIDPISRERTILGGRDLTLSGPVSSSEGFTVWKEHDRVLVLELSEEEEGMLELLEFALDRE